MNKYDALNPISSSIYAQDARVIIKDILSRNKTPVIEGGSPFYISQIFNPNLTSYNDETFHEARRVAKRIIELDGFNFNKTYARASEIFKKSQVPDVETNKIGQQHCICSGCGGGGGPNDFYRLENKMAFALYL